jgi:hypothetical protein
MNDKAGRVALRFVGSSFPKFCADQFPMIRNPAKFELLVALVVGGFGG